MARKISVKLILELRNSGLSVNQIANSRHISKHSVSDVFRIANEIRSRSKRPASRRTKVSFLFYSTH